ncbi:MAG: L-seryl-tRNA(Sec) selenium transferase [Deltaproteobacteria bacterium]|nr:L-seryl-tRNA(Sec) selenium transferase [Deltaproteobacteria bacterium]
MKKNHSQQNLLQKLPSVDRILEIVKTKPFSENIPKSVIVRSIRVVIENLRSQILSGNQAMTEKSLADTVVLEKVKANMQKAMSPNLIRVVNATGVVVHTNLGRSLLAADTLENLTIIAGMYSNLEFDLETGKRGSRYSCVEDILCEISGAEAAMVVNNNAGAVLLCLETIARGRKVIVSRGELVEIGGSFRIPDVMERSGGILKEVGTTNRTHVHDYQNAIDDDTALLLKVHKSNYSIVGFSAEVSLKELVELGKAYHLPVMEDLGSGTFIDFSEYGLLKEPTVQESVASQADVITFSGDKLLGGPQAGIIVGKSQVIEKIKKNPITRALRIDKLTLAALESTLRLYRTPQVAVESIPTLRMLTLPFKAIEKKAQGLAAMLGNTDNPLMDIQLLDRSSKAGGGALPLLDLPSKCVGIKIEGITANAIERSMRNNRPPIIGRIEEDFFIMDLRTIREDEFLFIKTAFDILPNDL